MELSDINRCCFRLIYDVLYIYLNMYFRCDLSRFSYAFVNNYFYSKLFFGPHGSHGRLFLRMKKIVWSNLWLCEHIAAFISLKNGRLISVDHCRDNVMNTLPLNVIFVLFVCLSWVLQSNRALFTLTGEGLHILTNTHSWPLSSSLKKNI